MRIRRTIIIPAILALSVAGSILGGSTASVAAGTHAVTTASAVHPMTHLFC
jgi:hypothetical protein